MLTGFTSKGYGPGFVAGVTPFVIENDGKALSYFLSPRTTAQPIITQAGRALQLQYNDRFYVMTRADRPNSSGNRSDFLQLNLIGKRLSLTVRVQMKPHLCLL